MDYDFDKKMIFYLGLVVAGIFILPINSDPPIYFIAGIILALVGTGLIIAKLKKSKNVSKK